MNESQDFRNMISDSIGKSILSALVIEWIKGFEAWHNEQAGQQEAA